MSKPLCRLGIAVSVCVLGWFAGLSSQAPPPSEPEYVADEVLVRFRPESTRTRRDAIVRGRGARVLRRLEALHIDRVQLPSGTDVASAIAGWRGQADVLSVEPNYIRRVTSISNDPHWLSGSLWGLAKIQAEQAWLYTTGSAGVVVADFDTGVDYTHPDLAANMWRNPGEIAGNGVDDDANGYVDDVYGIDTANDDSNPMDDHGHGTHTAGTIGAIGSNGVGVVGVNWNVRILTCKFMAASGSGTDAAAIECFNYIVALKKKGVNIRATSNSWGGPRGTGPFPTSLKAAVDAAGNEGILNVFAAGNSGANNDAAPFDPASFTSPSIVSVAASDSSDAPAGFSNYGATSVDLAAPGVSILSTTAGGGFGHMSGTSMATPHVAGAAALMAALKPSLTVPGVKTLLIDSVDQFALWSGKVASGGRLNVYIAALDATGDIPPTVSLTLPLAGSTFLAPATVTVAAAAADADGTVTKVDFFANGTLIGTDTTSPYSINWPNVTAGSYSLSAVATDNQTFTATSATVPITVNTSVTPLRVNVALASNGATASASSVYSTGYAAAGAINGERSGVPWGNGGGWNDATPSAFPDWLQIDFASAAAIDEISVFSVQDNYTTPAPPTAAMTFGLYGLRDFQVQYWNGSAWLTVPGGTITGNNLVWRQITFAPVTTSRIRVHVTNALNAWSRITEIEAYSTGGAPPPPPPPTGRLNVALASSGATASASSVYSASFAAAGAINGERNGAPWGNGGGWNDATASAFPDWLQVDFASVATIDEISVFSVQDNYGAPSTPTATMTFSLFGLRDFQVQYWNGSAWLTVPGGTITGNNLVWRQITFAPVTTSRIRVHVTNALNAWSRITEIEAYSSGGAPPPPPPAGRQNVALTSSGATASASSVYSTGYAAAGAINGERNGAPWGTGGGWNDATPSAFPDWLQIDFASAAAIDEISVFSVQDNYTTPAPPTAAMTFGLYGLRDFQVQYWNGSAWLTVPGGTITGNNLVWRQITFAPVTTSRIRVLVTSALNTWSRITEVEAWAGSGASPALIGFPSDNWWNLDISTAPVEPNSASYIAFINNGGARRLHPDFGGNVSAGSDQIYGIPYVVVDSSVSKKAVQFYYSSESDGVDHTTNQSFPFYPIPDEAVTQPHLIEGGEPGNIDRRSLSDRHLLIVDRDKRHLYELWNVYYDGAQWLAGAGAFFDMNTNDRRPEGWTSADAAGLAILPGLVRYDEAFGSDEIEHAFRVTVRATNGYVYPASHGAGSTIGALPLGARLRLKASKDLSGFAPELQRIFRAMKRFGLIVADNGSDMFISGAYDARWDNDVLNPAFRSLVANDFEVISLLGT